MKQTLLVIIEQYLINYPEEKERLSKLLNYLSNSTSDEIVDWNNTNGHLTSGAFIYCKTYDKFLVLFHKDLNRYLYPGGHAIREDKNPLETAKRELKEETGLSNLELNSICDDLVPFDIDTHVISYNKRVNMPQHYHFDFRYLFFVDKISSIAFEQEEIKDYKWISPQELNKYMEDTNIINKLMKMVGKRQ